MNPVYALATLPMLANELDESAINGDWTAYDELSETCAAAMAALVGIFVSAETADSLIADDNALSTRARMLVALHTIAADVN